MSYVSLHNHTDCSLLDGYQTIHEMVSRAKELGYPAIAQTEHGTMRGTIAFYNECIEQGIKGIIGTEFYFCPDYTLRDRKFTHHLVLLAMNNTGYYNMKLLDSIAYREDHFFYKPRIDEADLRAHSEGLICLSSCMASAVNSEGGEEWFCKYRDIFGDRFFAEIQPLNIEEQWTYNAKVITLARKYNVPLVCSTDAHFARAEDEPYHQYWIQSHGNGYHDNENYLWSEQEIRDTHWIPDEVKDECIENTQRIADICNVTIEVEGSHYPVYPTDNPAEKIREICRANWKAKVPAGHYKEYADRFNAEMEDLQKANYCNYLLIIYEMLTWCIENNIPIGEGRGSVSGCLVAYLMDIHKVDPLQYNTEFFRFCNVERQSPADVDSDVSRNNRGEVIEHLKERWGTVCKVQTLGYTKNPEKSDVGKAAVQRAGQALANIEKQETGDVIRWTPARRIDLIKGLKESIDEILTVPSEFTKAEREQLLDVSKHFCYRLDKTGIHASAVLVTPDAIENYTPVEGCYSNDTSTGKREYIRAACYEFHTLERMGCLKADVLGLGTLSVIDECLKTIDGTLDLEHIPMDDKATYDLYASGNLAGVFQMESNGMRRVAQELHVSCFDDIAALLSIWRPGPIDSGMVDQFIQGKNGGNIEYPCDAMKEITENTYGVMIYQEQCMKLAMKMAGYSLGKADALRKIVGRKEMTKIDAAVQDFVESSVRNGYTREAAESVGLQIKTAGRYIFNRCLSGREYIFRNHDGRFTPNIGEMYRIKNDKDYAKSTGHRELRAKYRGKLGYGYAYSMADNGIVKNHIVDIRYSGVMPVYVVTTDTGKHVRCTMNHKIPTPRGVKLLEELSVGDELYTDGGYDKQSAESYLFYKESQGVNAEKGHAGFTRRSGGEYVKFSNVRDFMKGMLAPCEQCGKQYTPGAKFELHHVDHNRNNNDNNNLRWLCNGCHKRAHYADGRTKKDTKGRIVNVEHIASIEYECNEDCYDVEMEAPNHNFVTGEGIIVCNSHAVSYAKLSYKTAYLKVHYPVQFMCALMNSKTKQEDVLPYIDECHRLSIEILPPDYSVGNRDWTVDGNAIRCGLCYIKGVGKNLTVKPTQSWSALVAMNNKRVTENLIKAGALDYIGRSRGWMLANLEDTQTTLKRKAQCQERIAINEAALSTATTDKERAKAQRQLDQWKAKMSEAEFTETAESSYDATAGEIEVLSFSFNALPKVLTGTAKRVTEFNDKNGHAMARIAFSTKYGEFEGVVFASAWKKQRYRDRYRGMVAGITVEQGKSYEFMMKKGVFVDVREIHEG